MKAMGALSLLLLVSCISFHSGDLADPNPGKGGFTTNISFASGINNTAYGDAVVADYERVVQKVMEENGLLKSPNLKVRIIVQHHGHEIGSLQLISSLFSVLSLGFIPYYAGSLETKATVIVSDRNSVLKEYRYSARSRTFFGCLLPLIGGTDASDLGSLGALKGMLNSAIADMRRDGYLDAPPRGDRFNKYIVLRDGRRCFLCTMESSGDQRIIKDSFGLEMRVDVNEVERAETIKEP